MRQQISKDLFAHWGQTKGARAAPDRADIDPAAIRHLLADTFIMEVDDAGLYPLRLCGGRVNALWLRDQKGASFLDLWRGCDRASIAAALVGVVDDAAPVVAGVKIETAGHAPLELELLLLPLRHFGKTHARVLGALAPVYQPEWLGQLRAGPLSLISMRVIETAPRDQDRSAHSRPETVPAGRARPRLVVYEGDKMR